MRSQATFDAFAGLKAALVALVVAANAVPAHAQQARQPSAPQSAPANTAANCFEASEPARIAAGCDVVLAAARGTYTADQTGFAWQRRGGARVALGQVDEAIADFRQMASAGYKPHEAQASIAGLEFRRQRWADAERAYREALRINPSYALAHSGLGHTLTAQGKPAEAVTHFDRALATNSNDASLHLGKGSAQYASGDLDSAIRSLGDALRLSPGLMPALFLRAQAHQDKGDRNAALADADAVVAGATGEDRVRALTFRGRLRNAAKTYATALADCTAANTEADRIGLADPAIRAAVFACQGLARQSRGEYREAVQSYENALRWSGSDATALAGRGYVAYQRGQYDAAAADFEAVLRNDPRSQDALRFLGLTYADKGELAKAETIFARAIAVDPRDPWPIMIRAVAIAKEGRRDRALADVERALRLTGDRSSDAMLVRGAVHYFLDDLEKSRTDVEAALRLDPENGQAHRLQSRINLRQNRLDDAQRGIEAATRLLPNDAGLALNRGLLALARRNVAEARRELTASIELNDAHAESFVARGQVHEAEGRPQLAIADYRLAEQKLATDPDGRRAKATAQVRLAALTAPAAEAPPAPPLAASSGQGRPPASSTNDPRVAAVRPGSPTRPADVATAPQPTPDGAEAPTLYCRLVEGVFVHSRRYTGVAFDVGCGAGTPDR